MGRWLVPAGRGGHDYVCARGGTCRPILMKFSWRARNSWMSLFESDSDGNEDALKSLESPRSASSPFAAMAAPAQSPLRRWKRFFGAFDSVDAAIETSDPVLCRGELRRARGDIFELLCDVADHDHAEAERLCLVLDGLMAESLETLRLIKAMPTVLATTDLAKSLRALRRHDSERVRVLASGIVSGWRASMQDDLAKVREAMHKLDNVLERNEEIKADLDATTRKTATIVGNDRVKAAKIADSQPPLHKKTAEMAKKTSDPAVRTVRGDRAELCSEERMEAAKRKFQEAYKEAENAKRQRRTQRVVESPEMLKQRQKMNPTPRERSRATCPSSMVRKSFSVRKLAS
uniref:Uncharacterized protein n=1 Tax=Avena sativa TaxID=4498 RepID=A0ACD5UIQ1_AVESA